MGGGSDFPEYTPSHSEVLGIDVVELYRLIHAYLSITDPQRRLEALRMLEAIAGADTRPA